MGPRDAERVHQPDRVRGHRVERIGRVGPAARLQRRHHRADVRRAEFREEGRAADVAVVEPHDPEAAPDEAFAERIRPAGQGRREAVDQQDDRIALPAEGLVGDVDPVGADAGHGGSRCVGRNLPGKRRWAKSAGRRLAAFARGSAPFDARSGAKVSPLFDRESSDFIGLPRRSAKTTAGSRAPAQLSAETAEKHIIFVVLGVLGGQLSSGSAARALTIAFEIFSTDF